MSIYEYRCAACGKVFGDFEFMADPCSFCGCTEKASGASFGYKMPAETTSAEYNAWFHSDSTQSKLKSGEWEIAGKDHNINHL